MSSVVQPDNRSEPCAEARASGGRGARQVHSVLRPCFESVGAALHGCVWMFDW
jgi:hypothetical protein